ncbi:hypothetical protein CPT_Seuss93 [Caulobacter phage Seuss]|uniref:Uncharacterized protein n=1 Tax=Caulobacter phage Seuss TaxID=1675601 RepID=A0A0K1LMC4_9CAUD|nr:hypothetical protein HOR08_gp093 [Caulobacter phage Seuss]AKU43619.1 hypothetical protein CPT_Seuss93 [Caulobacter phage Seuss]
MKDTSVVFEFKVTEDHHPHIYVPISALDRPQVKYSILVPLDKVPHQVRPCFRDIHPPSDPTRSWADKLSILSNLRPEVIVRPDRVDHLAKELARLDARNLSRDRIFIDRWVIVQSTFRWNVNTRHPPFWHPCLESVTLLEY